MAIGRHLSLEEAQQKRQFRRFGLEHPSVGDRPTFDRLLAAMARGTPPGEGQTSNEATSED